MNKPTYWNGFTPDICQNTLIASFLLFTGLQRVDSERKSGQSMCQTLPPAASSLCRAVREYPIINVLYVGLLVRVCVFRSLVHQRLIIISDQLSFPYC